MTPENVERTVELLTRHRGGLSGAGDVAAIRMDQTRNTRGYGFWVDVAEEIKRQKKQIFGS